MLGVLMALMLPANFLVLNATGPVFFDSEPIAFVYLNGTEAAVEIPLVPGLHEVVYENRQEWVSFFDFKCSTEGKFSCNVTAHMDLKLPYSISCGKTQGGELVMTAGSVETIEAEGECTTAALTIGDWKQEFEVVNLFENYIVVDGDQSITVKQGDKVILQKYGRGYVSFPELLPGEYHVTAESLEGKLLIKPNEAAVYGYVLSAVIVMAAIALLWMG